MKRQSFTLLIFLTFVIDKNTSKERHHRKLPDFQRTHWYSLTSPTDTIPSPGEYVDYHLAPDPAPAPSFSSTHAPPTLHTDSVGNVTSQLGQTVYLKCTVIGFRQGVNTVSWTKTTSRRENPIALTFNDKVHQHFYFWMCVTMKGLVTFYMLQKSIKSFYHVIAIISRPYTHTIQFNNSI